MSLGKWKTSTTRECSRPIFDFGGVRFEQKHLSSPPPPPLKKHFTLLGKILSPCMIPPKTTTHRYHRYLGDPDDAHTFSHTFQITHDLKGCIGLCRLVSSHVTLLLKHLQIDVKHMTKIYTLQRYLSISHFGKKENHRLKSAFKRA